MELQRFRCLLRPRRQLCEQLYVRNCDHRLIGESCSQVAQFVGEWFAFAARHGTGAFDDRPSKPGCIWNRIPDAVSERIVAMALDVPDFRRLRLSPVSQTVRGASIITMPSVSPRLRRRNLGSSTGGEFDFERSTPLPHCFRATITCHR